MGWDEATKQDVYAKSGGHCQYCGKQLARKNYGKLHRRGAWEIDHSNPVSLGGTDYFRNLWPACISCNRSKGDMPGPRFRRLMQATPTRPASSPLGDILKIVGLLLFLKWLSEASNAQSVSWTGDARW